MPAPYDVDREHAALLAIAKPLRVAVNINRRARHYGKPWVELFHRGMMLSAHWDFNDALAWLQAGQRAETAP